MVKLNNEKLLFSAIFLLALAIFILRLLLATSYLPETGGVSINVLYGILRIINGSFLYTDPEMPPYPIIQYMPLHFYGIKLITGILGIQNNVHAIMVTNRIFCLLIDSVSVILIARSLIKYFHISSLFAWTLAMIYFVCIPGIIFGRGDNLYLLFFILTIIPLLVHFLHHEKAPDSSPKLLLIAGLTSALAVNAKQTGIFLVVLCLLFIFLRKNIWRDLFKYAMGFSGCTLLIFLFTHPASSALALKLNVIDGVKNGLNINWFMEVFLKNYFLKFSYLLTGGIVVALLLLKSPGEKINRFTGLAIIWYFTAALLSSFKAGSGPNYYLEFIILSIFGLALLIHNKQISYEKNLLFALVISPFFIVASANDKGWGDIKLMKAAKADYHNSQQLAAHLLPLLKEDQWILTAFHKESTLNLHLSDKALFPCREVALYFTKPLGVFHFKDFSKRINTASIPYIVDYSGEFPDTFMEDSLTQYRADTTIGNYTVYKLISL